jgi:hypothetical protein
VIGPTDSKACSRLGPATHLYFVIKTQLVLGIRVRVPRVLSHAGQSAALRQQPSWQPARHWYFAQRMRCPRRLAPPPLDRTAVKAYYQS